MAEFFKVFPCPTDKLIIPFIRDFKNLKKEVLADLIDNSVRHMRQLDFTNVNLDNDSITITLYPKVGTELSDLIKVYQLFFKEYRTLRDEMCTHLALSVVYRHDGVNFHLHRQKFNKYLNLIMLLLRSMAHDPDIVDISRIKGVGEHGLDYTAISERIREWNMGYILGTQFYNGSVGIEHRIHYELTQQMYNYYHKNKKHFDGRLGKLPSTPWYCE